MRVAFCTPTPKHPHPAYLEAMAASVPLLDAAGIAHAAVYEVSNPYISGARATLLRKAMIWGADAVTFLDHDLSWSPGDLVTLIQTAGDVVGGTYRFKIPDETYMCTIAVQGDDRPIVRDDGAMKAVRLPAGFLKVTRAGIEQFMRAHPELIIRDKDGFESPDLFHHGAHKGTWFGEDYAFSRNWIDAGGDLWLVPDLDLDHHEFDGRAWKGNFHRYLLRQPGGSEGPPLER